eukprot:NODE_8077_length_425_cov_34.702128_g7215_i0.p5 GENE.NODE_8077_length_425_cov_34.702128_g7215_i0~~NODE_8077_length_425_cov_34.702128_g7215_i0.p5  ORF type:complete len:52 (+),score=15.77 NODE_8077_length_425_cov_34.702128_g7215_i0:29-184(+)
MGEPDQEPGSDLEVAAVRELPPLPPPLSEPDPLELPPVGRSNSVILNSPVN